MRHVYLVLSLLLAVGAFYGFFWALDFVIDGTPRWWDLPTVTVAFATFLLSWAPLLAVVDNWKSTAALLLLLAPGAHAQTRACTDTFTSDADLHAFILDAGDTAALLDSTRTDLTRNRAALARANTLARDLRAESDSLQRSLIALDYARQDERRASGAALAACREQQRETERALRRQRLKTLAVASGAAAVIAYLLTH